MSDGMNSPFHGMDAQGDIGDNDGEFPRFLNRERVSDPALPQPPPLPQLPWIKHWNIAHSGNARVVIAAIASLGAVAFVTAALLTTAQYHMASLVPPAEVLNVEALNVEARPVELRADVADAVEIETVFEARLSYASNLARQLDTLSVDAISLGAIAVVTEKDGAQLSLGDAREDRVALMILRNLPETATFPAGAPGGSSGASGVWVMASGEPEQLVMNAVPDRQEAVVADVEMISQSGQSLGVVQMPVSKGADGAGADAVVPPLPAATVSEAESPKPVKRRLRLYASKTETNATSDARAKRRAKRADDALKIKTSDAPAAGQVSAGGASDGSADEKPAGPLTKFFAWLKSGAKPSATEVEQPSVLGLAPRE